MGALIVGAISGIICAATALLLGASWLTSLMVYSVTGVLAAVVHAAVLGLLEPVLLRRKIEPNPTDLVDSYREEDWPVMNTTVMKEKATDD